MRIVLATPLYPPDIAEPSPYVKELAKRLATHHHVTIVTYGHLPEQVPGVEIVAVDKRQILLIRLVHYFFAVWEAARAADVIYAQNGPSIEVPIAALNFFLRRPLVVHWGDKPAHLYAQNHILRRMVEGLAFGRAHVVTDSPPPRPEILPLEPRPEPALAAWEGSWQKHLSFLEDIFTHAK